MLEKLKNIFKNKFIRNVFLLASGTAAAQIITVLVSPIITRLYGPEAYGVLGTFTAMANIIIPIAALTYPIAIVLPKKDEEAIGMAQLSLIITFLIAISSLSILVIFKNQIINIFNLNEIANYIYLIPLIIIFAGIMQTTQQWLIRINKFSINAKAVFYQSVIINGSKVGLGFYHPFATTLVFLTTLSSGVRAIIMILFTKLPKFNFKNKNIFKLAKKYNDFPLYRAPEELISGISHGIPILMLSAFFGPAAAGFYSIGRSVLSMPSQFVGVAIGDVFYPKATQIYNSNKNITKLILKTTIGLAGIGIIPFGLVILFGPILFSFVFGAEWMVAGEYARWIALWSFTNFINKPSVRSLAILNAQKFHLLYTIFGLICRLIVLFLGFYWFASDRIAVALFGSVAALLNIGLIYLTVHLANKRFKSINDNY